MGAWKVLTSVILVEYYNHLLPSALEHHSLCPEVVNLLEQEAFSVYKLTQNLELTEWKNTCKCERVSELQTLPRDLLHKMFYHKNNTRWLQKKCRLWGLIHTWISYVNALFLCIIKFKPKFYEVLLWKGQVLNILLSFHTHSWHTLSTYAYTCFELLWIKKLYRLKYRNLIFYKSKHVSFCAYVSHEFYILAF